MRIGVFADVHANVVALEAVLAALAREGAQQLVCAGDLVGYGPRPLESVARVSGMHVPCVAGNHDLIVLGELPDDDCIALARRSLDWTRAALDGPTREVLRGLPLRAAAGRLEIAHGSLDDPREYVTTPERAVELLGALGAGAAEDSAPTALVLGHTHVPLLVAERTGPLATEGTVALPEGERIVLNPGAVGQSRERDVVARGAVLDLERREVRFLTVPYDDDAVRADLRDRGLSPRGIHIPPPARARRAARTAGWYARWARRKVAGARR